MKKLLVLVLTLLIVSINGCGGGGSSSGTSGSTGVTINVGSIGASSAGGVQSQSIPSTVASIRFTISASDMTTITRTVSVAGSTTITESFDVPNGNNRLFLVEALNSSGTVIYSGSTYANLNGTATTLSITMTSTVWVKTYGGASQDILLSVQQTSDSGYIVAGYTTSFGAGYYDFWVSKLNSTGGVEWQKAYGGASDEAAIFVRQTSDGGYIVAGEGASFGAGSYDFWVLKLASTGGVEWEKAYGGLLGDNALSVRQTSDGGYIVAGQTQSFGAGSYDIWVLKLASTGAVEWEKAYGGSSFETTYSIQQTSDSGYIVAGYTNSFSEGDYDFWVLKLASTGAVEWEKTYGGSDNDYAYSIQQTSDSGYIVTGQTYSYGAGSDDMWVLKLNSTGGVDWQKTYGGSASDWARSIQRTSDGGYIVVKDTKSFGAGLYDAWILKLTSAGDITWEKAYGGTSDDWVNMIQQTSDGGYITVGGADSFGAGSTDFWVLKLPSDGAITFGSSSGATKTNTSATVSNTSVTGSTTSATITATSATVTTTSATATDTTATISQQAP